ncbi:hypothetical protein BCR39DRAFT_510130 [Naematelia encephala]|uniref:Uncharacterized protein n=1 Tax=Naematelia encephala TaxID=71784 RepID=A0A1Y2BL40_9TREE|nr:hypothetical protein BCR39DRAFT_510130 [Naematelia encephala]
MMTSSSRGLINLTRSAHTAPRRFATALSTLPNDLWRLAPLPTLPSSLATSSRITLDIFPDDPIASTLQYASDAELVNAILAKERMGSWTASIDPATAFLCLRTRPTFPQFTQRVSHVEQAYKTLRSSGLHQLLVSDLLLRNPDPQLLRDVLELDTKSTSPLRPSLVVSIYSQLHPLIQSGHAAPLSHAASMLVYRALVAEQDTELVPHLWQSIFDTSRNIERTWDMFEPILQLTQRGDADTALKFIRQMVEHDLIPEEAIDSLRPSESEDRALLVQSIVLRCCLHYKMFYRARQVSEILFETMEHLTISPPTYQLLLESCRVALAGGLLEEIKWVGEMLPCLAKHGPLPAYIFDAYISEAPWRDRLQVYAAIPHEDRAPPSPINIIRLAARCRDKAVLQQLLRDTDRHAPSAFVAQTSRFLGLLAKSNLLDQTRGFVDSWDPATPLSSQAMLDIIAALVVSDRSISPDATILAKRIIATFAARQLEQPEGLALAQAYLLINDRQLAQSVIDHLDFHDPMLRLAYQRLVYNDLGMAFTILDMSGSIPAPPIDVIAYSCVNSRWAFLTHVKLSELPENNRHDIVVLKNLRRGKIDIALRHALALDSSLSDGTWAVFLVVAARWGRWPALLQAWEVAPKTDSVVRAGHFALTRIRQGARGTEEIPYDVKLQFEDDMNRLGG